MVLVRLCVSIIIASFLLIPAIHAAEPTKVLIAHGAISNNVEPLWIAKEQGIFRKYGIEAELVFIIAGRAMQAMLAGQVPVGLVGGTHVVNANTGGGDFSMVLGLENRLDYLFLAKPTIKSGEDLKGKKVGIGTPAGSASMAAYVALDHLGLVPRRDNIVLARYRRCPGTHGGAAVRQRRCHRSVAGNRPTSARRRLSRVGRPGERKGAVSILRAGFFARLDQEQSATGGKYHQGDGEGVAFIHKPANKDVVMKSLGRNLRLSKPEQTEKAYQGLVGCAAAPALPVHRGHERRH